MQIRLGGFKNRGERIQRWPGREMGVDLRGVGKGENDRSPLYELLRELIN